MCDVVSVSIRKSSVFGSRDILVFAAPALALVLSLVTGCQGSGISVGAVGDGSVGDSYGGRAGGSGGSGGSTGGPGNDAGAAGQGGTGGSDAAPGKACSASAGSKCPAGQFCELKPGQCQVAGASGVCTETALVCTAEFVPVCGCDGKTYSNDCEAAAAGVSVATQGACP